jgi:hypothetical protein
VKHHTISVVTRSLFLAVGLACPAFADVIDLTLGGTSRGTVNGAIFEFGDQGGGTGNLGPFVRLQANGSERGYNTSNRSVPFDEKTGIWTHDLRLNEVPVITKAGIPYLEILLDVNENTGNGNEFLSLDALRLYTSPTGSQNTTDISSLGTLRYDLDTGGDSVILMDYSNAPGSGETDMTVYIPTSALAGVDPTQYLYLYSEFGLRPAEGSGKSKQNWSTCAGFEEWAVEIFPTTVYIPEPATLGLPALGGLAMLRRKRRSAIC